MRIFHRLSLVLIALFVLGAADQALAWGPATHVAIGNTVLSQLSLLPAAVATLLARYGVAYLYGNVAADVVFAKRMSRVKQFCHHWSTAMDLLKSAPDDQAKAFAYGYLSHLAADTVAHGKFVPRQIILSDCSVNFGHFYWEVRADATQPIDVWDSAEEVLFADHDHHHLELSNHLKDTLLSYDINRALFERLNGLAVRRTFRLTVDTWGRFSRYPLSPRLVEAYQGECVDRVLDVLSTGSKSPLLREDPNGTSALTHVRFQRRHARRVRRDAPAGERWRRECASGWSPRLAPRAAHVSASAPVVGIPVAIAATPSSLPISSAC